MINTLKKKLYLLFASSIMLVFTTVFSLLAFENIKTMQNADLNFFNRQATNLILLFENSKNYTENLEICEEKYDYAFRLFTQNNKCIYESSNENVCQTIDIFLETLKSSEITDSNGTNNSAQTGIHTFQTYDGKTYYGILCSIYNDTEYLNLAMIKEKNGLVFFSQTIIHYFFVWLIVLIIILFVSILIIRQAMKPTEKAMKSQKNFVAAVSHELKAPLAVILATTDVIETLPDCTLNIKNHVIRIETEISRMTRLIQDLLLLSSIDAGNWVLHKSEMSIDTLLINLYEKFEIICKQKAINLQLILPDECFPPIISDEERLEQIISIFVDNAISYSSEQSIISLEASIKMKTLIINIIDHGIGISKNDKKHIFDRFYRCDKSRTQKDHFGLGLSIATELITIFDGKIYLNDTPGGGCTFTVIIPCNIAE